MRPKSTNYESSTRTTQEQPGNGASTAHTVWEALESLQASRPGRAGADGHNRKRVLIAEDDLLVRCSLAAVLECEGFWVDEACDGVEALAQAVAQGPDLVLLDLNMPRCHGWRAFEHLDAAAVRPPVIMITAQPGQYPKAASLRVDAFMEKPLNIAALVAAVRRFTDEKPEARVRRLREPGFATEWLGREGSDATAKQRSSEK